MLALVCLLELPKWSGRLWSTRLPTAQWYSPNTGWRRCWSASDFWWAFLVVSRTVSLRLVGVRNTARRLDEIGWIDGVIQGGWASWSPAAEQLFHMSGRRHLCSDELGRVEEEVASFFQPEGRCCGLPSCWSGRLVLPIGSGAPDKSRYLTELYHCSCRNSCPCSSAMGGSAGQRGFPRKHLMARTANFFHQATWIFLSCFIKVTKRWSPVLYKNG